MIFVLRASVPLYGSFPLPTCSRKRLLFVLQDSTHVLNHLEKVPWPHSFIQQLFSAYPLCARQGARNMKVRETNMVPDLIETEW